VKEEEAEGHSAPPQKEQSCPKQKTKRKKGRKKRKRQKQQSTNKKPGERQERVEKEGRPQRGRDGGVRWDGWSQLWGETSQDVEETQGIPREKKREGK
jgi:hypothetical protein